MKTALILLLTTSASLLACGASKSSVDYLSGGLWETSVTMEEYVDPRLSDDERAQILDVMQNRQSVTQTCRTARANRITPVVGQPFSMGEGFVCEYTAVEAAGEHADRIVHCSLPRTLTVEISGEVHEDHSDLRIKVGETDAPERYAITREVSRLVGSCADGGGQQ